VNSLPQLKLIERRRLRAIEVTTVCLGAGWTQMAKLLGGCEEGKNAYHAESANHQFVFIDMIAEV
jgi:hypothetical protein